MEGRCNVSIPDAVILNQNNLMFDSQILWYDTANNVPEKWVTFNRLVSFNSELELISKLLLPGSWNEPIVDRDGQSGTVELCRGEVLDS